MIVKQRVSHRLAWPGGLLVLLVAVVVLPVVAQGPAADLKPLASTIQQPADAEGNESTQSESAGLKPPEEYRKLVAKYFEQLSQTSGQVAATSPTKAQSRVFPQLGSGIWRERLDYKVDGKVVTDSWWDFQLDFRDDRVTGHALKVSEGTTGDNILSGELIRARSNPSGVDDFGRFVSILVLRHQTSANGFFVISITRRVSENRFVGTWVNSNGETGDYELILTKENKQ